MIDSRQVSDFRRQSPTRGTAASSFRPDWVPVKFPEARYPFLSASTRDLIESRDPATNELVALARSSSESDVEEAVGRAHTVADRPAEWARQPARRAGVLLRFAASLRAAEDRLATLLTREEGKTIREARIEVTKAAALFEYYAGLCRGIEGRVFSVSDSADAVVMRQPLGVVAVIVPWNSPLILLARALAPALAAGNACVVKPASLTPAITVEALSLLATDPDLPRGTLSCVCGTGPTVGEALVGHHGVDMVSFTGASTSGTAVMKRAADGLKKVCLELGGKSPNIVFADAPFDKAVSGVRQGILGDSGQSCTAGSRLLLQDTIYDRFLDSLTSAFHEVRVGDGLDPTTNMGPLVSQHQKDVVCSYVALARQEGTVRFGGEDYRPDGYDDGFFVTPAIVTDVSVKARVVREEIFGPVLTVQRFDTEDDAVQLANDCDFGLAAAVWTRDVEQCLRVARQLNAGTVWINTYHHYYPEVEGGGFKASGIGRQQGISGLLEYTHTKHVNFDTAPTLW